MKTVFSCLYSYSTQFITESNADIVLAIDELNAKYPSLSVWWGALSTTLLISVIPYLILYLIPLDNSPKYDSHLKICLSLAAGGLLGDAFLHLIPESLTVAQGSGQTQCVGLWILAGFIGFFITEKIVRIVKNYCNYEIISIDSSDEQTSLIAQSNNNKVVVNGHKSIHKVFNDIKIAGYLNLAADLVHNFTDGLAIGSSFMSGHSMGLVTGIAIMVHEIPHEIGDFAVLIKSGLSRKKAMSLQLLTAIGALTGTVVSLSMGSSAGQSSKWVLPFTGGGFIYIGTVTILPELTNQSDLKQTAKELSALLFGIFIMTLIV